MLLQVLSSKSVLICFDMVYLTFKAPNTNEADDILEYVFQRK